MPIIISKSELADELRVSKPRVSQFVAQGLPTMADDRIDLEQACRWVVANIDTGTAAGEAREWLALFARSHMRAKVGEPQQQE